MITWLDVVKLCIPFVFSLLLVWFRSWFLEFRERKANEEALWRIIVQDPGSLDRAIGKLEEISEAVAEGNWNTVVFHLSKTPIELARRLAELDPQHAYIYNHYIGRHIIAERDVKSLSDFIKIFINCTEETRARVVAATQSQTKSLRLNIVARAKAANSVLDHLMTTSKKRDRQQAHQFKSAVASASERVNAT